MFTSSDAFKNLRKLQELLLDNNNLHWLSSGAFKDLTNLQYFKAARNRFSNLHDIQILHLRKVEIIDLQSNNIKYVYKTDFEQNKAIIKLYLSDNVIESIDDHSFVNNEHITYLALCFDI